MQIFFQTPLSSFVMSLFVCVFCCGFTVIFASIISAYCRVLLELLLRAHAIIGSLINPVLLLEIARSLAQKLARKKPWSTFSVLPCGISMEITKFSVARTKGRLLCLVREAWVVSGQASSSLSLSNMEI